MVLVAMLVMRYDIQPVDGLWVELGQNINNMLLAIAPPKRKSWGGSAKVMKNRFVHENPIAPLIGP